MPETNGLKTAVKNGERTPDEAKAKLNEMSKVTGYKSKRLMDWLKKRGKT